MYIDGLTCEYISGKYAWSEDLEGGWLLSAIDQVFSSGSAGDDLLSLLTQVCGEVASREAFIPNNERAHCSKSTACVYHKLSKDIYFPSSKTKYSDVDCWNKPGRHRAHFQKTILVQHVSYLCEIKRDCLRNTCNEALEWLFYHAVFCIITLEKLSASVFIKIQRNLILFSSSFDLLFINKQERYFRSIRMVRTSSHD